MSAIGVHPGIALYVGPQLRMLRQRMRLHQRDLAAKVGIHGSMVNLWEQDRRPMPHERIDPVARALGTTPQRLLENVVKRLYAAEHKRDPGLIEIVDPPQPEPERLLEPVPPSARPSQLWCTSGHGTGIRRLHSHGYAPSWAPGVGRIDEWECS